MWLRHFDSHHSGWPRMQAVWERFASCTLRCHEGFLKGQALNYSQDICWLLDSSSKRLALKSCRQIITIPAGCKGFILFLSRTLWSWSSSGGRAKWQRTRHRSHEVLLCSAVADRPKTSRHIHIIGSTQSVLVRYAGADRVTAAEAMQSCNHVSLPSHR